MGTGEHELLEPADEGARLAELRTQLGLSSSTAGAGEVGMGTVSEQMPQAAPSTTEVPRKP